MAILTVWDNRKKTAVRLEFETEWTLTDLEGAIQKADDLIGSVEHTVDIIIDIEGANLPKDFMNMAQNLLASGDPRPNEGRRIVVGANSMVKNGYKTLQKSFTDQLEGREVLFGADLMDARAILRSLRMNS